LAGNDVCGDAVYAGTFELAERRFLESFLRAGMAVFDVGAHHGFYSLLASVKVGPTGKVVAFEPSPRERAKLLRHLRLNRCSNVIVEPVALSSCEAIGELYVVHGRDTGCDSLRPPAVKEPTSRVRVPLTTIDSCLTRAGMARLDLLKWFFVVYALCLRPVALLMIHVFGGIGLPLAQIIVLPTYYAAHHYFAQRFGKVPITRVLFLIGILYAAALGAYYVEIVWLSMLIFAIASGMILLLDSGARHALGAILQSLLRRSPVEAPKS
jgi:FkbM family methyltransferase